MSKQINDKITSQKQALAYAEVNLLPTILMYWETKSLNRMTVEAKLALQKLWTEYIRPGQVYNVTCADCPSMGLDSIGSWYCKSYGVPASVEAIRAGINGTIDEFAATNSPKKKEPEIVAGESGNTHNPDNPQLDKPGIEASFDPFGVPMPSDRPVVDPAKKNPGHKK